MKENIVFRYIEWHFIDAPKEILCAWRNCLKFNLNYWSLILLMKTLLSPWRRHHYAYGKGLDIKRFFDVLAFNIVSRVWGAVFRSFLIVIGATTEAFLVFSGATLFVFWLALPVLLSLGLFYGFKFLL